MRKTTARQKIFAVAGILLFMCLMYGNFRPPQLLIYNHTESIPKGWYLILPAKEIKADDIVGYEVSDEIRNLAIGRGWMKGTDTMMKKVGALEGDSFEVKKDQSFWVKGKYIGKVFTHDHKGQPMPVVPVGKYQVGKGKFLPVTSHPFSFDGRYFGAVEIEKIKFKAIPLTAFYL